MVNATGWSELFNDGNLISAAYTMYLADLGLFFIAILFFVFQAMIMIKTKNPVLAFTVGAIFVALYVGVANVPEVTIPFFGIVLVLELTGVMYWIFFK